MPPQGWVYLFIFLLGIERLVEMALARRNRSWILSRGGREFGRPFSRVVVLFHVSWFAAFAIEAAVRKSVPLAGPGWILGALVSLQIFRYWCIAALGRFWNTDVLVLPGAPLVRRGPYRWLRHPNYLVVAVEIPLYPALFGCWFTAALFGALNLWVLKTRITEEERALQTA